MCADPTAPESSSNFPGHALSTLGSVKSGSGKTYGHTTGRNSISCLKITQHQNKTKLGSEGFLPGDTGVGKMTQQEPQPLGYWSPTWPCLVWLLL